MLNLKLTNCRNPYPGVFQGFRPTRIDPSRQVSMSAAHMGPLYSICYVSFHGTLLCHFVFT